MKRLPIVIAVQIGLLVPILLMLTAMAMEFRYRIEFCPFLEFSAFIALGHMLSAASPPRERLLRAATAWGIVAAQVLCFLYWASPNDFAIVLFATTHLTVIGWYRLLYPIAIGRLAVVFAVAPVLVSATILATSRTSVETPIGLRPHAGLTANDGD